jgi:1L-myo-inositol 1-phosphate cytidylyltransferase / CDP-L-myo-inositol myo-inositolphosphotransferase
MDGGQIPSVAVVAFASASAAARRVAGVAVAARIVRELAEAGFASARLVLPAGDTLGTAAMNDVRRLAGAMEVRIGEPPAGEEPASLPGDRLIPAQMIAAFLAGDPATNPMAVDLAAPGAGAEILRRTAKTTDGPVSRWLNRPVSRFLSALLLRIPGFTPLHASIGTALLAAAMFLALVFGGMPGLIAGGLLFQAASVFDGVDGEVARATFRTSPAGARLDTAIDTMTTLLFVIGLTVNLASIGHPEAVRFAVWGVALFLLGLALIAWRGAGSGRSLNFHRIKQHYRGRPGVFVPRFIAFATLVTSRDFFALFFAVLIVSGWPMLVLYVFAAAASLWILFVAGSVFPAKAALAPERV